MIKGYPDLIPQLFDAINLLTLDKLKTFLNTSLAKIYWDIGTYGILGVQLLVLFFCEFDFISFFWIFLKFYFVGKLAVSKVCLKINNNGLKIAEGEIFSIRIIILSYPWSFFESRTWIILSMPSMENFSLKMRFWLNYSVYQRTSWKPLVLPWNLIST